MSRPFSDVQRPIDLPLTPRQVVRRWRAMNVDASVVALLSPEATPSISGQRTNPNAAWSVVGYGGQSVQLVVGPDEEPEAALHHLQSQIYNQPQSLWVGYLSYDLGRRLEPVPNQIPDERQWPLLAFHRLDGYLLYDHAQGQWFACGGWAAPDAPAEIARFRSRVEGHPSSQPLTWQALFADLTAPPEGIASNQTPAPLTLDASTASANAGSFIDAAQRVKDFIAAGDVFQVNLAHQLQLQACGDPGALFDAWQAQHPAYYSALLPFIDHENRQRVLVSGSPELFIAREGRQVCTRPIKGTRPLEVSAEELIASSKDAAELHMIVDLMRNDLGRVCDYGSVRVTDPRSIETHPTVHHGVATLEGTLKPGVGLAKLLQALMPGGSITGAPKVRAMQIIEALENERRGPYCGTIGWIQADRMVMNIAIRTAAFTHTPGLQGRQDAWALDFGVGSGIIADSEPEAEYDETMTKAQAFREALARCQQPSEADAVAAKSLVSSSTDD